MQFCNRNDMHHLTSHHKGVYLTWDWAVHMQDSCMKIIAIPISVALGGVICSVRLKPAGGKDCVVDCVVVTAP